MEGRASVAGCAARAESIADSHHLREWPPCAPADRRRRRRDSSRVGNLDSRSRSRGWRSRLGGVAVTHDSQPGVLHERDGLGADGCTKRHRLRHWQRQRRRGGLRRRKRGRRKRGREGQRPDNDHSHTGEHRGGEGKTPRVADAARCGGAADKRARRTKRMKEGHRVSGSSAAERHPEASGQSATVTRQHREDRHGSRAFPESDRVPPAAQQTRGKPANRPRGRAV